MHETTVHSKAYHKQDDKNKVRNKGCGKKDNRGVRGKKKMYEIVVHYEGYQKQIFKTKAVGEEKTVRRKFKKRVTPQ